MNQLCLRIKDGINVETIKLEPSLTNVLKDMEEMKLDFTEVSIKVFTLQSNVEFIIIFSDLTIDKELLSNLLKHYNKVVSVAFEEGFRIGSFATLMTVYKAIDHVKETI